MSETLALIGFAIVSLIFMIYFALQSRYFKKELVGFTKWSNTMIKKVNNESIVDEWIDKLTGSFFMKFKHSIMGSSSADKAKHSKINRLVQDTVTKDIIPNVMSEAAGMNPLVGKILMKLLGDSPVGEYLDENPEDFPYVMNLLGGMANQIMQGFNKNNVDLSQPAPRGAGQWWN